MRRIVMTITPMKKKPKGSIILLPGNRFNQKNHTRTQVCPHLRGCVLLLFHNRTISVGFQKLFQIVNIFLDGTADIRIRHQLSPGIGFHFNRM